MSFHHRLTVGFLDADAVARCEAVPLRDLSDDLRELVRQHADADSFVQDGDVTIFTIGGESATLMHGFVELPWYSPRLNVAATCLAREAVTRGCLVADVRHARVVAASELG